MSNYEVDVVDFETLNAQIEKSKKKEKVLRIILIVFSCILVVGIIILILYLIFRDHDDSSSCDVVDSNTEQKKNEVCVKNSQTENSSLQINMSSVTQNNLETIVQQPTETAVIDDITQPDLKPWKYYTEKYGWGGTSVYDLKNFAKEINYMNEDKSLTIEGKMHIGELDTKSGKGPCFACDDTFAEKYNNEKILPLRAEADEILQAHGLQDAMERLRRKNVS